MSKQYKEYYEKIQTTLGETLMKKFHDVLGTGEVYDWAREHERGLIAERAQLKTEIDELWLTEGNFETFKKTVLAWGKCELRIFEAYSKWVKENPAPTPHPHPGPLPEGEGIFRQKPREPVQVGMF